MTRNKQFSLPGTGPDFAGLARLKASQPIRPRTVQEPCDHGLFSDQADQTDITTLIREVGR